MYTTDIVVDETISVRKLQIMETRTVVPETGMVIIRIKTGIMKIRITEAVTGNNNGYQSNNGGGNWEWWEETGITGNYNYGW